MRGRTSRRLLARRANPNTAVTSRRSICTTSSSANPASRRRHRRPRVWRAPGVMAARCKRSGKICGMTPRRGPRATGQRSEAVGQPTTWSGVRQRDLQQDALHHPVEQVGLVGHAPVDRAMGVTPEAVGHRLHGDRRQTLLVSQFQARGRAMAARSIWAGRPTDASIPQAGERPVLLDRVGVSPGPVSPSRSVRAGAPRPSGPDLLDGCHGVVEPLIQSASVLGHQARDGPRQSLAAAPRPTPASMRVSNTRRSARRSLVMTGTPAVVNRTREPPHLAPQEHRTAEGRLGLLGDTHPAPRLVRAKIRRSGLLGHAHFFLSLAPRELGGANRPTTWQLVGVHLDADRTLEPPVGDAPANQALISRSCSGPNGGAPTASTPAPTPARPRGFGRSCMFPTFMITSLHHYGEDDPRPLDVDRDCLYPTYAYDIYLLRHAHPADRGRRPHIPAKWPRGPGPAGTRRLRRGSDPLCLARFTRHVRTLHRAPDFGQAPLVWFDHLLDVATRSQVDVIFPTQEQVTVLSHQLPRLLRAGLVTAVPPFASRRRCSTSSACARWPAWRRPNRGRSSCRTHWRRPSGAASRPTSRPPSNRLGRRAARPPMRRA